jgi:hypothetical protein
MRTLYVVLDRVRALVGQSIYEWRFIRMAALAVIAEAWGLATLVRLVDAPIITIIN